MVNWTNQENVRKVASGQASDLSQVDRVAVKMKNYVEDFYLNMFAVNHREQESWANHHWKPESVTCNVKDDTVEFRITKATPFDIGPAITEGLKLFNNNTVGSTFNFRYTDGGNTLVVTFSGRELGGSEPPTAPMSLDVIEKHLDAVLEKIELKLGLY